MYKKRKKKTTHSGARAILFFFFNCNKIENTKKKRQKLRDIYLSEKNLIFFVDFILSILLFLRIIEETKTETICVCKPEIISLGKLFKIIFYSYED